MQYYKITNIYNVRKNHKGKFRHIDNENKCKNVDDVFAALVTQCEQGRSGIKYSYNVPSFN